MSDPLQDGEAKSQAILEAVADGIITVDEQGIIDSFNPAAEKIFRYTATEAAGQNISELIPDYYGPVTADQASDPLEALSPRSVEFKRELEGRRKDGSTFPIDLAVTEIEIAGRRYFISIVGDLTEQLAGQDEERRMAAIVNSVGDAIISCDTQGIIDSWNSGAEVLYGYTAQEAIGRPLHIITPREFASAFDERIETAIARETSGNFETQRLTKDERKVEVSISVSRIFDAQGNVIGLVAVHRDVSSQKLAEKGQRDLAVVEERNRLAREIHDTLAQSLTMMVLRLELAGETMESDPAAAREELESVKLLATKCLEEARRSVWDLQPQALDSAGLVEAVQVEVERLWESNIEGELRVSGAEAIAMDPRNRSAALRIVQEALNNIINHSKAKTAVVALRFEPESLRITVVDNGIGFEPRAVRVISPMAGGFGLNNMQERARLTGGSMQVHSNPGQGTSVVVYIPYHFAEPGITDSN